jgi:hypothetical protein
VLGDVNLGAAGEGDQKQADRRSEKQREIIRHGFLHGRVRERFRDIMFNDSEKGRL